MPIIRITNSEYFTQYQKSIKPNPKTIWKKFTELPSYPSITFARQSSAVFSSRIEGVDIDLNFYLNSRLTRAKGIKAETRRTMEWVKALEDGYNFAESHILNEKNFLKVHFMISKFMDNHRERGTYRRVPVIIGSRYEVVYTTLPPELVAQTMQDFWSDIKILLHTPLPPEKALYYSSLIHAVFEKIHPFTDGNGRIGRLLEKWFLAKHCGKIAWKIGSEAYYEQYRSQYYSNLKAIGKNWNTLDFGHCIPFLSMLPLAVQSTVRAAIQ